MTNEEAVKILEVAKAECEWNAPLEYQEAFDIAISALEKQIPKKKINAGGWNVCPTCGHWPIQSYCNGCGQRIDWTEGEG